MHFGLFCLMTQRDKAKSPGTIYKETVEHVRMAERIGMEIAWFAEHHFSNYCLCPSPLTMTTYMAGQTSTIRLGPAVIVAPLYEPIRLMEDIGMADQISGGRLVLGFGTGYQEYEFHKFSRDLKQARQDLFDVLDLADCYFNQEIFRFSGRHVNLPETAFSVRPVQKRPQIYVAGMAGDIEAQRRAAERGYIPFFTTGWNSSETVAKIRETLSGTFAQAGGEVAAMPFAIQRYVFVTDSREDALKAADGARYVRRIAQAMRGKYGELEGAYLKEVPAADEPSLEEIAERLPIGDPNTVAERLARDIELLNPHHISCFMAIPGLTQQGILASMERFGSEVIPLLERRYGDLSRLGTPMASNETAPRQDVVGR
ncbi:LLM class flavin-dependent oxidoreductase [Chelativorans sp. Marseille-P2723]|uniref:LLM class flavin-dependent oxidoreductase n=1 Tax=Chelativorans sp. Marseille-P2723 TaxID=2709133 RepID=UPI00156E524D|nr:LLM class flavin-dependent oxidoreductase [Chelativorans sp. Marseille-P2723]